MFKAVVSNAKTCFIGWSILEYYSNDIYVAEYDIQVLISSPDN